MKRGRYIHGETGEILCPVAALLAYLALRGALPGPLFQLQDRSPLTKDYFIQKFREALTDIGLEASKYAGHSFIELMPPHQPLKRA